MGQVKLDVDPVSSGGGRSTDMGETEASPMPHGSAPLRRPRCLGRTLHSNPDPGQRGGAPSSSPPRSAPACALSPIPRGEPGHFLPAHDGPCEPRRGRASSRREKDWYWGTGTRTPGLNGAQPAPGIRESTLRGRRGRSSGGPGREPRSTSTLWFFHEVFGAWPVCIGFSSLNTNDNFISLESES
jgi:hypothetical protein